MKKEQARKEIQQLSKAIEEHNHRYYVLDQPSVADKEYDDMLRRLIVLEKEFSDLAEHDSPTKRIGAKAQASLAPVLHRNKMYSLDNTYSVEELKAWHERVVKGLNTKNVDYIVELKIDGVSCALTYEKGSLAMAATRGDGTTGENVTANVMTIKSAPLKLKNDFPDLLDIRGEVFIEKAEFEKINKARKASGAELFANPRNAASGTLKLLDSTVTAKRNLKIFIHSFGEIKGRKMDSLSDLFEALRTWGLPVSPHNKRCDSVESIVSFCREYEQKRSTLPFEVDGVVIKVNNLSLQRKLGETMKSPRWAVAYKFAAQQATTKINKIVIQVGRTGVLTPVAELEPVNCGGVTIARSTLHNFDEIKRLAVREGDTVLIERAGDVIPKVVKVVKRGKSKTAKLYSPPKECPQCGGAVVKVQEENVAYRCVNPSCPKQLERKLIHFASRGAMDIEGMGEAVVGQLLEKKMISDIADIYTLKKDDLMTLELFKEKKAGNLIDEIEKSKKQPLSRLIFALGIPNIGEKASRSLARQFLSLDALAKADEEKLMQIDEVGPMIAASAGSFFKQPATKGLVEKLRKAKVTFSEPKQPVKKDSTLFGKKFVFTGELASLTREEASALAVNAGAEVVSSVSKATDFLVVGDAPGSKYNKAVKLGVSILNENQFKEMVHA